MLLLCRSKSDLCKHYVFLRFEKYKSFSVDIGTRPVCEGDIVQFSTSKPFLVVPQMYFRPFVRVLGGLFNPDLNLYTVDCSSVGSLPSIGISVGTGFLPTRGLTYNVTSEDYVAKIVRFGSLRFRFRAHHLRASASPPPAGRHRSRLASAPSACRVSQFLFFWGGGGVNSGT